MKLDTVTAAQLADLIDEKRAAVKKASNELYTKMARNAEAWNAETDSKRKAELQREQSKLWEKIATLDGEAEGLREALVIIIESAD